MANRIEQGIEAAEEAAKAARRLLGEEAKEGESAAARAAARAAADDAEKGVVVQTTRLSSIPESNPFSRTEAVSPVAPTTVKASVRTPTTRYETKARVDETVAEGDLFATSAQKAERQRGQQAAQQERQQMQPQQESWQPQKQQQQQSGPAGGSLSDEQKFQALADKAGVSVDDIKALTPKDRVELAAKLREQEFAGGRSATSASGAPAGPTPVGNQFEGMGLQSKIADLVEAQNVRAGRMGALFSNALNDSPGITFSRKDYEELRGILSQHKQLVDGKGTIRIGDDGTIKVFENGAERDLKDDEGITSLLRQYSAPDANGKITPIHTINDKQFLDIVRPKLLTQIDTTIEPTIGASLSIKPGVFLDGDATKALMGTLNEHNQLNAANGVATIVEEYTESGVTKIRLAPEGAKTTTARETWEKWSKEYQENPGSPPTTPAYPDGVRPLQPTEYGIWLRDPHNRITMGDFEWGINIPQHMKRPIPGVSDKLELALSPNPLAHIDDASEKALRDKLIELNRLVPSAKRNSDVTAENFIARIKNPYGEAPTTADYEAIVTIPNRLKSPEYRTLIAEVGRAFDTNEAAFISAEKVNPTRDELVKFGRLTQSAERSKDIDADNFIEHLRDPSKKPPTTADYDAIVTTANRAKLPNVIDAKIAINDGINTFISTYESNGSVSQTFMNELNKQLSVLGTAADGGRMIRDASELARNELTNSEQILRALRERKPISHEEFTELGTFAQRRMPWKGKEPEATNSGGAPTFKGTTGGLMTSALNASSNLVKPGKRDFPLYVARYEFENGGLAPIAVRVASQYRASPLLKGGGTVALAAAAYSGMAGYHAVNTVDNPNVGIVGMKVSQIWTDNQDDKVNDYIEGIYNKMRSDPKQTSTAFQKYFGFDPTLGKDKAQYEKALEILKNGQFVEPINNNLKTAMTMYVTQQLYNTPLADLVDVKTKGVDVTNQDTAQTQANIDKNAAVAAMAPPPPDTYGQSGPASTPSPDSISDAFKDATQFDTYLTSNNDALIGLNQDQLSQVKKAWVEVAGDGKMDAQDRPVFEQRLKTIPGLDSSQISIIRESAFSPAPSP